MRLSGSISSRLGDAYLAVTDKNRLSASTAVALNDDTGLLKAIQTNATSLDLSDDAKKVISRYKSEKAAADRLQQQSSIARNANSAVVPSKSKGAIAKALFAIIGGQAPVPVTGENAGKPDPATSLLSIIEGQPSGDSASVTLTPVAGAPIPTFDVSSGGISKKASLIDLNDPVAAFADPEGYHNALRAKNIHDDGTIDSWNVTIKDVVIAPKTADEIDYWYKTEGQSYIQNAVDFPSQQATEMADAIKNRTLTLRDARDVPGLKFHNWVSYDGGEGGSGNGGGSSYNADALKDSGPDSHTFVTSKGVVVSWTSKAEPVRRVGAIVQEPVNP